MKGKGKKNIILIIDDSPEDRTFYKRMLEYTDGVPGFEFHEANTGGSGIQMYKEVHPDCVLLDYRLPDMDGLEILDEIQSIDGSESAIIMLTGHGSEDIAVKVMKSGVQDYLVKDSLKDSPLYLSNTIRKAQEKIDLQKQLLTQQEQLKEANEKLEKKLVEVQQFAYIASHDLQEPLRKINNFTELLSKKYKDKLDESANRYISFIEDGAKRMNQLIDNLLTFSRLDRAELNFERANLTTLVNEVLRDIDFLIEERSASIKVDTLPTLKVLPNQIKQLFQNLIENAIKYCERKPKILITAKRQDSYWEFAVRDNGIGIEDEYYEKIFEIFQRLHATHEYSGTGIGLAICDKILEKHGGRIWLYSEIGKGSTFYFTLPENLFIA